MVNVLSQIDAVTRALRTEEIDGEPSHIQTIAQEYPAGIGDIPADMWDAFGPGTTGVGWDHSLLGLALHLGVQDSKIAPEEGEEWALSDEGKAFARASADRWADADIAAGADREVAARTAEATYGFSTGQTPDV